MQQVDDLLHGRAKVEIRPLESSSVDFSDVFNELEEDRKSSFLASQVVTSDEWYRLSADHQGYLEKVSRSGDIQVGKIQKGEFVEASDLSEKISGQAIR